MTEHKIVEELMTAIDDATVPDKMTKPEAKDMLDEIIEQCRSRIDAIVDEMMNEGGEA